MSSGKAFRRWYLDRDFPEIKASNAEILLVFDSAQRDKAQALCDEHSALISEKDKEIKRLRAALEFYADGEGEVLDWDKVNNPACIQDRGKVAREALAGGKE